MHFSWSAVRAYVVFAAFATPASVIAFMRLAAVVTREDTSRIFRLSVPSQRVALLALLMELWSGSTIGADIVLALFATPTTIFAFTRLAAVITRENSHGISFFTTGPR